MSVARVRGLLIAALVALGATTARAQQAPATENAGGTRSHRLVGAAVGFVVGGGITYLVLHSGGSTAPCNQSANQDAMSSGECLGLTFLGAAVGAGLGAIVGGFIKSERSEYVPIERLRIVVGPQRTLRVGLVVGLGR